MADARQTVRPAAVGIAVGNLHVEPMPRSDSPNRLHGARTKCSRRARRALGEMVLAPSMKAPSRPFSSLLVLVEVGSRRGGLEVRWAAEWELWHRGRQRPGWHSYLTHGCNVRLMCR